MGDFGAAGLAAPSEAIWPHFGARESRGGVQREPGHPAPYSPCFQSVLPVNAALLSLHLGVCEIFHTRELIKVVVVV